MAELIYGIRKSDGKIISIYDIPVDLKGLRCDCICPHCKTELIAKKGDIREYHFAHYNDEHMTVNRDGKLCTTNIEVANQTALHRMAKEIMLSAKNITFPAYEIDINEIEFEDIPDYILDKIENRKYIYRQKNVVAILSVEEEKRIDDIITDIYLNTPIGEIMVEIAVTHFVDKIKYNKIKEKSLSTIEIDLSQYNGENVSRKRLEKIIKEEVANKKWIYRKDRHIAIKKAKEYFESTDVVRKYRWTEQQRKYAEIAINNILKPDNYKKTINELRNDKDFVDFASKNLWFYQKEKKVPYYIDIPITGEFIFKCDRRIWQGIIFDRYIYKRKNEGDKIPPVDKIFETLIKDYNIPYEKGLLYQVETETDVIFLRRDVIEQYLTYLDFIGFIKYNKYTSEWGKVVQNRKMVPADLSNYECFLTIIKTIDNMAPNIDDLLSTEIRKRKNEIYKEKAKKEQDRLIVEENKRIEMKRLKEASEKEKRENEAKRIAELKREVDRLEKEMEEKNRKRFEGVNFYSNGRIIRDKTGNRWVLCEKCKQIYPSEQMATYGGAEKNVGLCRKCEREERN